MTFQVPDPASNHAGTLGVVDGNRLHSPDTAYWPMLNGVRGGALRGKFN